MFISSFILYIYITKKILFIRKFIFVLNDSNVAFHTRLSEFCLILINEFYYFDRSLY